MTELLCAADGNVVEIATKITNKQSSVSCCISVRCFKIDKETFTSNNQMQLTITEGFQSVNIVTCQEAEERLTGLRCLFLVMQLVKPGRQFKYYIASLRIDVGKIVPLKQFVTTNDMMDNSRSSINHKVYCRIIDGPSLFWLSNGRLFTVSPSTESETTYTINSTTLLQHNHDNGSNRSSKILACCLLWASLVHNVYVCIGIQTVQYVRDSKKNIKKSFFAFSFIPCPEKKSESDFTPVDTNLFLPKEYAENVSCINVVKCQKQKKLLCFDTKLYVGTQDGYLMEFVCGRLLRAIAIWNWELNFVPPIISEIVMCSSYHASDVFIILQTDQDEVVALNEKEWKVCERWNNVQRSFVEDFMNNGCDQILLLKDKQLPSNSWILTDLHTVHIENSGNGANIVLPKNSEPVEGEDSTESAIRALEQRQQSELVALHDEEEMMTRQIQFLNKTWKDLQLAAQGLVTKTTIEEPSLVRLIEGKSGIIKSDSENKPFCSEPDKIQVLSIWQRNFANKWIVGVDLINCTDKIFKRVTLSMVPKSSGASLQESISCTSICYCMRKNYSKLPDPYHQFSKRRKTDSGCINEDEPDSRIPPNCQARLICIADTPRFGHLSSFDCCMTMQWTDMDKEECDTGIPRTSVRTGNGPYSFCCGDVMLSMKDMMEDAYTVRVSDLPSSPERTHDDIQKDLDVLNACQLRSNLIVNSASGRSLDLNTWLRERAGFQDSSEYNCFVISRIKRLANTRLIASQAPRGENRLITVYTCNEDELYMLVHYLYSCLPDDVLILPDDETEKENAFKTSLTHLTEELQFLCCETEALVTDACRTSQTNSVPESGKGDASVDVERIRRQFSAEKSASVTKCETKLDEEHVKKFLLKYTTVQEKTDFSIAKLFSMH